MIIKNVTQVGNPVIGRRAKTVTNFKSPEVKKVVRDLVDSMRHHGLVGMAVPQIGKSVRVFVTEIRSTKFRKRPAKDIDPLRVFINPRIIKYSRTKKFGYEGCGSVAESGIFAPVRRATSVTVLALNKNGKRFKLAARGLLAVVIEHEHDHLDGKVFLDRDFDPRGLKSRDEYLKPHR